LIGKLRHVPRDPRGRWARWTVERRTERVTTDQDARADSQRNHQHSV